jgi:hypothetical protein
MLAARRAVTDDFVVARGKISGLAKSLECEKGCGS